LNALLKVLKNEKYFTLLLLVLFVFNSAVFLRTEAKAYTPSAGASNLYIRVDKENSPQGVSKNAGFVGNLINQFNDNGPLSSKSFSTTKSDCIDIGLECNKLSDLAYIDTINPPTFNAVDAIANLNGTLIDQRPISAVDYFQDKVYALTHFNTVSAQAAVTPDGTVDTREAYYSPGGTGFSLLKPIQNFWSWSVRVVYGFLLIIVIIIAFAIMFRQRLSGSVEVTVQNAIPAIALAMILVPLSYAISGLFIDFITVGTNAVHAFLIGAPGSPGNTLYTNSGVDENLYKGPLGNETPTPDRGYYPDDIRVDWLRARDRINVSSTFGAIGQDVGQVSGLNGNVIFLAIGSIVNLITGQTSDDPADFTWVGDIVQFFISIVTMWIGLQIFVALFKKYMTIILYPIISPFIFATVAIPGNGTKSIMQYAKVMLAAALAYIVTYAMFLLTIIFTSQDFLNDVPTFASASFNPPLIGLRSIGIGSNEMTQLLLTLIGLGIYFSIPSTLKSIDDSLGANNPLPKFLTTPIDSFNESRKVMFKTAPALAARATRLGASGIKNTAYSPFRANTALRDTLDRARGINPETNYNSYRNKTRRGLAGKLDDYKADLEDAKRETNPALRSIKMAAAQAKISSVGLAGDRTGTGVGLQGELAGSAPKFIFDEVAITISRTEVPSLINSSGYRYENATGRILLPGGAVAPVTGAPSHAPIDIATGTFKAKVEGTGVTIKTPITLDFAKTKTTRDPNIDVFDDSKIIVDNVRKGSTGVRGTLIEAFGNDYEYKDPKSSTGYSNGWTTGMTPVGVTPALKAGSSPFYIVINTAGLNEAPKGDNSFDVPYTVYATNVVELFGNELNAANNSPTSAYARLRSGYDVRTKKVAVKVADGSNGIETKAFRVSVKLS